MSQRVVSFTKLTEKMTPYWLLEELAAIDAVLIFKFANSVANISYAVPAERTPRDDYLCRIFNDASDDFRLEYVNEIWDLVGLPRNECPVNVSEIRIPLYPIFSFELSNGCVAAACYNCVREELATIPVIVEYASREHLQRIALDAIRDRIVRIEQDQDANWKADYWEAREAND